jgi:hypothetical protein
MWKKGTGEEESVTGGPVGIAAATSSTFHGAGAVALDPFMRPGRVSCGFLERKWSRIEPRIVLHTRIGIFLSAVCHLDSVNVVQLQVFVWGQPQVFVRGVGSGSEIKDLLGKLGSFKERAWSDYFSHHTPGSGWPGLLVNL